MKIKCERQEILGRDKNTHSQKERGRQIEREWERDTERKRLDRKREKGAVSSIQTGKEYPENIYHINMQEESSQKRRKR